MILYNSKKNLCPYNDAIECYPMIFTAVKG